MNFQDDYPVNGVVYLPWPTRAADGSSIVRSTDGNIRIYKDDGTTQRASSSGITDVDNFDGLAGCNLTKVDLSDNADAGFYAAGHFYWAVLEGGVIDTKTVNTPIGSWWIERPGGTLALLKSIMNGSGALKDNLITNTVLADGAISAAKLATDTITAAKVAADVGAELADAIWDEDLSGHTTAGSAGKQLQDIETGTAPTPSAIADAVWDELLAGHLGAGSAGEALVAAALGGSDPWAESLPGAYPAGSAGFILGTNLNLAMTDLPTAEEVAAATWDEPLVSHNTPGTAGEALTDASSAGGDPWETPLPGAYGAGTAGKILGTNLDVLVSSRATPADVVAAIAASVASMPAAVWGYVTRALTDKSDFALSSTGLNAVAAPTDPSNDAEVRSSFMSMFRGIFNRFFNEVDQTSTQQRVRNDAGTVHSTMPVSNDLSTQVKGKSA